MNLRTSLMPLFASTALLIGCSHASPPSHATSPILSPFPTADLCALNVSTSPNPAIAGGCVSVTCTVTNTSDHDISYVWGNPLIDYDILVTDSHGIPVPLSNRGKQIQENSRYRLMHVIVETLKKSGGTFHDHIDLVSYYNLPPGSYTVQLSHKDRNDQTSLVVSNKTSFTILSQSAARQQISDWFTALVRPIAPTDPLAVQRLATLRDNWLDNLFLLRKFAGNINYEDQLALLPEEKDLLALLKIDYFHYPPIDQWNRPILLTREQLRTELAKLFPHLGVTPPAQPTDSSQFQPAAAILVNYLRFDAERFCSVQKANDPADTKIKTLITQSLQHLTDTSALAAPTAPPTLTPFENRLRAYILEAAPTNPVFAPENAHAAKMALWFAYQRYQQSYPPLERQLHDTLLNTLENDLTHHEE